METGNAMTRRSFATLWPAAAGAIGAPVLLTGTQSSAATASSDSLQSELPFDLLLEPGPRNSVGASRTVVAVSGGTFEGPRLKGTVVGPAGDWITVAAGRLERPRSWRSTADGRRAEDLDDLSRDHVHTAGWNALGADPAPLRDRRRKVSPAEHRRGGRRFPPGAGQDRLSRGTGFCSARGSAFYLALEQVSLDLALSPPALTAVAS